MSFQNIHTALGDLRLVLAPGMEIPKGEGPVDVTEGGGEGGGGQGAVIPSYEVDTEDWRDKEESGGGGGMPGKQKPKPKKGEKGEKDDEKKEPGEEGGEPGEEKGEETGQGGQGEETGQGGQGGEGGEEGGEGGGLDKGEFADVIKEYVKSGQKDSDDKRNKQLGKNGDPIAKDILEKNTRRVLTNPRTRHHTLHPGYKKQKDNFHLPGFNIGKELNQTGYRPFQSGKWKEMVRRWFKSRPIIQKKDTWRRRDPRIISAQRQLLQRYGSKVLTRARKQPFPKKIVSKTTIFVDVSGSVFDKGIQFDFTSIIKSIPQNVAEIYIFTFDAGVRSEVMRPWNYEPMEGGGGTQPWEDIQAILKKPFYQDMDGYMMLTDGQFAAPTVPLAHPEKWCFVLTSELKGGTTTSLPKGCTIVHTYIEDPEYVNREAEKGRPKDPFKKIVHTQK